jgi:acetylornithine deacetylase/succinyl-diaminopimelate desuccinylase-like protein
MLKPAEIPLAMRATPNLDWQRLSLGANIPYGEFLLNAYEVAAANHPTYLNQLKELLRLKSISALSEYKTETAKTASWIAEHLLSVGMAKARVINTAGHPLIYAEWLGAPGAPTVLIYGHYDVQPPYNDMQKKDPAWKTEPFEPVEIDGNLVARGSSDDKGQLFVHIKAVESILKATGKLPVNVKFIIEGEEEVSGLSLDKFIHENAELLKADVCVISDSHVLATDRPLIVYSLRGMAYFEVRLQGAQTDLHSGAYGGVIRNTAQTLAEIIAGLHNADGSVNVPGFYGQVLPIDPAEREAVAKIPWTDDELMHEAGTLVEQGEQGFSRRERAGLRPTLEINGMVSGFTGEGSKTVLPSTAMAKISCRLVANQDPDDIFEKVKRRIEALTPAGMHLTFIRHGNGYPARMDIDSPQMQAAIAAYEKGFNARPVFLPEGGSIPVVATIRNVLQTPVLLIGFGLPDDNLHAPDEKFSIAHFYRGIDTSIALLDKLAEHA